jgi:hypothetical protein
VFGLGLDTAPGATIGVPADFKSPLPSMARLNEKRNSLEAEVQRRLDRIKRVEEWSNQYATRIQFEPDAKPDPRFVRELQAWHGEMTRSLTDLPRELLLAYQRKQPQDAQQMIKLIQDVDFKVQADPQIRAITQLCNRFIYSPRQSFELTKVLSDKTTDHAKKRGLRVGGLLSGELNLPISRYDSAVPNNVRDSIAEQEEPKSRLLYDAARLLNQDKKDIAKLTKKGSPLSEIWEAKSLEQSLLEHGVPLGSIKLNGVPYARFHPNTASAVLKILSRLGAEYVQYALFPGVMNRPHAFIRDVLEAKSQGLNREQIWSKLSRRTVRVYRFVGASPTRLQQIMQEGMRSSFLRQGGNESSLPYALITKGLDYFILNHISYGAIKGSPVISTTPNEHSLLAYKIAMAYNEDPGSPIQCFAIDIPIYQTIVARTSSEATQKFEVLAWGAVARENLRYLRELPSDQFISSEDFREEMASQGHLQPELQEPPLPPVP